MLYTSTCKPPCIKLARCRASVSHRVIDHRRPDNPTPQASPRNGKRLHALLYQRKREQSDTSCCLRHFSAWSIFSPSFKCSSVTPFPGCPFVCGPRLEWLFMGNSRSPSISFHLFASIFSPCFQDISEAFQVLLLQGHLSGRSFKVCAPCYPRLYPPKQCYNAASQEVPWTLSCSCLTLSVD